MATVKLNAPVNARGEVTTISDLIAKGLAKFTKSDCWHSPRSATGLRTIYMAELVDGSGFWEVSKVAYHTRTTGTAPFGEGF